MDSTAEKAGSTIGHDNVGERDQAGSRRKRRRRRRNAHRRSRHLHADLAQPPAEVWLPDSLSHHVAEKFNPDDHCSPAPSGGTADPEKLSMVGAPYLCPEQWEVVQLITQGHNVFYTGGAGTGKSTVLRAAVARLRDRKKRVTVITPTGISALNVGGSTYFRYAGWSANVGKYRLEEIERMAMSKQRRERVMETDVLIIDEISMLESNQFRRLDRACRHSFCDDCGSKLSYAPTCPECGESFNLDDQWAFCSDTWTACQFRCISLSQIHRQSEPAFIHLLNTLRIGAPLDQEQMALLPERDCSADPAVELCPLRDDVNRKNLEGFQVLTGPVRTYRCHDYVKIQPNHTELAAKLELDGVSDAMGCQEQFFPQLLDHRLPALLETKIGMPVILLANVAPEEGLVNGSQGLIIGYTPHFTLTRDPDKQSTRFARHEKEQISLFESHQGSDFRMPIVRFENGRQRTMLPVYQDIELGDPRPFSVVARTQIPLLPAWAITIHKSQGMTLSRAVINLGQVFEPQMAYVALSRVRGLDGVRIKNRSGLEFVKKKVEHGGGIVIVRQFMEACFGPQEAPPPFVPK